MSEEILLDVRHLTHVFPLTKKIAIKAVDDVSFQLRRGEIFGLVGESGSGKSTAARCVMNIYRPCGGSILYKGIDTCDPRAFRDNRRMLQTTRQLIFQTAASLMPAVILSTIIGLTICSFIINPLTAVFLSSIGIVKCTFSIPAAMIAAAGIILILFTFSVTCLLSVRIKRISPRALLAGE